MGGDERTDRIRERAHEIWEREGRPEGRDHKHWEQATREIDAQEGSSGGPEAMDTAGAWSGQGVARGLQPGGAALGGGPGASAGSLGSGGGSTAGRNSGAAKRGAGQSDESAS